MHNAARAYGKIAKETANPRDLESSLLLKAAAQLQAIRDNWNRAPGELDGALLYNRKLWTIFMTSVTEDGHQLPPGVRQNIANLGIFVLKHTLNVQSSPNPDSLKSLITINREVAAGLRGAA
ncbi:MAG: flagellar biosynthesis regulatory protein FlaF [Xanthobacteraceae bacterium]|nr:MAG: flagellar biosynthesis regulatory protein FlaF [Xanthobacteraceae bacterium]